LLKTLNVDSKINGFVKMDLQKRAQEAALSGLVDNMLPSAIFNRFDHPCVLNLDRRTFLVVLGHLFYSCFLFLSKNLPLQNSLLCLS
jgi:hypothetical protein